MSPEQARGKPVDKRTDIWAFGCVLYEMLTGQRAFAGDTISDTIAAILEREPDWIALPPATPAPCGVCCAAASRRIRSSACATSATRESRSRARPVPSRRRWRLRPYRPAPVKADRLVIRARRSWLSPAVAAVASPEPAETSTVATTQRYPA